jgi:hypothetical protein
LGHAFRIARACPPVVSDFLSYEALGIRYDRRDFFKGTGVSMYRSAARARDACRRFRHGSAVAAVDLQRDEIVWSPTGRHGHITVWGAPASHAPRGSGSM